MFDLDRVRERAEGLGVVHERLRVGREERLRQRARVDRHLCKNQPVSRTRREILVYAQIGTAPPAIDAMVTSKPALVKTVYGSASSLIQRPVGCSPAVGDACIPLVDSD